MKVGRTTAALALLALALAGAGPTTSRPASRRVATTAPVLTLAESDRLYARRADEAGQAYERAMQAAGQERVRQLRGLLDRALDGKRLDEANRIQAALATAEAELQARERRRPVTLHVTGTIDGRCVMVVRQGRASWQQLQYGYPTDLTVNGVRWDPSRSPALENGGKTAYLPARVDWRGAALVKKAGRDPVEVVAGADEVRITFDDTDPGTGKYDLTIELPLPGAKVGGEGAAAADAGNGGGQ